MAKYQNILNLNTTDTGKRYYSSALLESYTPTGQEFIYTAQLGDRWDLLAYRFYGSVRYWYVLARANGGADGSLFITPGKTLIIPEGF